MRKVYIGGDSKRMWKGRKVSSAKGLELEEDKVRIEDQTIFLSQIMDLHCFQNFDLSKIFLLSQQQIASALCLLICLYAYVPPLKSDFFRFLALLFFFCICISLIKKGFV